MLDRGCQVSMRMATQSEHTAGFSLVYVLGALAYDVCRSALHTRKLAAAQRESCTSTRGSQRARRLCQAVGSTPPQHGAAQPCTRVYRHNHCAALLSCSAFMARMFEGLSKGYHGSLVPVLSTEMSIFDTVRKLDHLQGSVLPSSSRKISHCKVGLGSYCRLCHSATYYGKRQAAAHSRQRCQQSVATHRLGLLVDSPAACAGLCGHVLYSNCARAWHHCFFSCHARCVSDAGAV